MEGSRAIDRSKTDITLSFEYLEMAREFLQ